jgi:glutaredoxin
MTSEGPAGPAAEVVLYTRRGCHLCDDAKAVIDAVRRRAPFDLAVVDIDSDPALVARFNDQVPVVFVHGRKAFKYRVDARELERRLHEGRTARD